MNPCEQGWMQATATDMGCLFFEPTKKFNWDAASAYCKTEQNATLVEILTQEQLDFLQMMQGVLGAEDRWTGATDEGRESKWFWITTLNDVAEFVWRPGFPSNGVEGNCMSLHPDNDKGLGGIDNDCGLNFKPICQKFI
jgi:hypothetical protein